MAQKEQALLEEFLEDWRGKVDRGEVSPLDRSELLMLNVFINWLTLRRMKNARTWDE